MKKIKTIKIEGIDLNKVIDIPVVDTRPETNELVIQFELKDG